MQGNLDSSLKAGVHCSVVWSELMQFTHVNVLPLTTQKEDGIQVTVQRSPSSSFWILCDVLVEELVILKPASKTEPSCFMHNRGLIGCECLGVFGGQH